MKKVLKTIRGFLYMWAQCSLSATFYGVGAVSLFCSIIIVAGFDVDWRITFCGLLGVLFFVYSLMFINLLVVETIGWNKGVWKKLRGKLKRK